MTVMGKLLKKRIREDKILHPEKLLKIDEILKDENSENFPICALAKQLEAGGVETEVSSQTESDLINKACLQMAFNGLANKTKVDIKYDFGEKKNYDLLGHRDKRQNFHEELKEKISKELNIPKDEMVFVNPHKGSYKITIIFLFIDYQIFTLIFIQILEDCLKKTEGFISLTKSALVEALKLDPRIQPLIIVMEDGQVQELIEAQLEIE